MPERAPLDAHALLRAFQNATDVALCVTDEEGRFVWLNRAYAALTGYRADELLHQPLLRVLPPDARERGEALYRRVLEGVSTNGQEWRYLRKDGGLTEVYATPAQLRSEGRRFVVTTVDDLKARKEAEARQRDTETRYRTLLLAAERQARELALLEEVRLALAYELDLPTLFETVVESVYRTFGYAQVSLYLVEGDTLALQQHVGEGHARARLPLDERAAQALMGKAAVLRNRLGGAPLLSEAPLEAELIAPLFDGDKAIGVLGVGSAQPLSDADLRLMTALSQHIGIAITRTRLYSRVVENERKYRSVIEKVKEVIFQTDAAGRWTLLNPAWTEITGLGLRESSGRHFSESIDPADRERSLLGFAALASGQASVLKDDVRYRTRSGELRWLSVHAYPIRDEAQGFMGMTGTLIDITERKRAAEALRRREAVLEAVSFAAERFLKNHDWTANIEAVLSRLGRAAGVDRVTIFQVEREKGAKPQVRERHGWVREGMSTPLGPALCELERWEEVLSGGGVIEGPVLELPDREAAFWQEQGVQSLMAVPVSVAQSWWGFIRFDDCRARRHWSAAEVGAIKTAADTLGAAIEQQSLNERLIHQVRHDALTGLPNRVLMRERLAQTLTLASRHRQPLALMLLDLDNFKLVNDSLGHSAGDALLVAVGERLVEGLRASDTVARLGGDEFILILPMTTAGEAAKVAQKVLSTLAEPFMIEGHELYISPSIGLSLFPTDGNDGEAMLKAADAAMYGAKRLGKNTYQFYAAAMNPEPTARLSLETEFRKALARDQFRLYFQPRVDLRSYKVVSLEALVRWQHPSLGLVFPQEFIPLAEQIGLIHELGSWVLHEACCRTQGWRQAGHQDLKVSVNLSSYQFRAKTLVETVGKALAESGLAPAALELEITENMLIQDVNQAVAQMRALKANPGLRLAIDDFGTGYSSLSYLQRFPVDTLKIDKSFILDIGENRASRDLAIIKTIVSLGQNLGLNVVAEGIETEGQLAVLRALGCHEGQGWLFSKAVPAEEVAGLLASGAFG